MDTPQTARVACPPHVLAFAYVAIGYTMACVVYLLLTRNHGTPFLDALTPEQRELRSFSKTARLRAFLLGIAISTVLLAVWRPLHRRRIPP